MGRLLSKGKNKCVLRIDGALVDVSWEDNAAARELCTQAARGDIVVEMSGYGGFEQVGSLGRTYPSSDTRITTSCGNVTLSISAV